MSSPTPIRFERESSFDVPVSLLWRFHMAPGALDRLAPPLSWFRVVDRGDGVADGSTLEATVGPWPLRRRWVAFHAAVTPNESFVDIALESPFRYWVHLHQFAPVGPGSSRLTDVVWFLPPRWVPRRLARTLGRIALRWTFWWRHRATRRGLRERAVCDGPRFRALCCGTAPGGQS